MCCLRNEDLPQNGLHEEEMRDRLAALAAEGEQGGRCKHHEGRCGAQLDRRTIHH
jgi:hypothetical protein